MNAVLIAVVVMLVLALVRVHVVVAMFLGSLVGGLLAGMGLDGTMLAFQDGLGGGAKIALSYALLGAFAMGVASTGLRSEEHTSELQSRFDLVCRLLLEKKN